MIARAVCLILSIYLFIVGHRRQRRKCIVLFWRICVARTARAHFHDYMNGTFVVLTSENNGHLDLKYATRDNNAVAIIRMVGLCMEGQTFRYVSNDDNV